MDKSDNTIADVFVEVLLGKMWMLAVDAEDARKGSIQFIVQLMSSCDKQSTE